MKRVRRPIELVALVGLIGVAACASRTEPVSNATNRTDPAVAGVLVIEQFLAAVNATNVERMAQLMGTRDGTMNTLYGREQVQTRMLLLAEILKHTDYRVTNTRDVPARGGEAVRADVRMTINARGYEVPYTLVWTNNQRWLIECIDVRPITGAQTAGAAPVC
jgi:hypothetical protein